MPATVVADMMDENSTLPDHIASFPPPGDTFVPDTSCARASLGTVLTSTLGGVPGVSDVKHCVTRMPDDLHARKSFRNAAETGLSPSKYTLT